MADKDKPDNDLPDNVVSIFSRMEKVEQEEQMPAYIMLIEGLNMMSMENSQKALVKAIKDIMQTYDDSKKQLREKFGDRAITITNAALALPLSMPKNTWLQFVDGFQDDLRNRDFPSYMHIYRQLGEKAVEYFHEHGCHDPAISPDTITDLFGRNMIAGTKMIGSTIGPLKKTFPDLNIKPKIIEPAEGVINVCVEITLPKAIQKQGKDLRGYFQDYLDKNAPPELRLVKNTPSSAPDGPQ